jgi:hypothetical protein
MSRAPTVLALASIACCGLVGCGTRVDYTPLRAVQMSQRSPAQVEVFLEQRPTRPYVEAGLLEARQESTMSLDGQSAILEELRAEAAEIGCDGIIFRGSANETVGHVGERSGYVTELKGYSAVCIVYTAATPPAG